MALVIHADAHRNGAASIEVLDQEPDCRPYLRCRRSSAVKLNKHAGTPFRVSVKIDLPQKTELLLDLPSLDALESVLDDPDKSVFPGISSLCFQVSPAPKLLSTGFATGDAVVGVVVGKYEHGGIGPASLTLEGEDKLL
jgi:hypothetical protein